MATAAELVPKVEEHVKQSMSKYDASHDFAHIKRVVHRAHIIHDEIIKDATANQQPIPRYDMTTITLSAMLHDIGDRKYVNLKEEDPTTMIEQLLLKLGADAGFALKIQTICSAVSYAEETKNTESRQRVQNLITQYPELAIVQDADRIDSIGAIGIGRVFTYGGAKEFESMLDSIEIFHNKLLHLVPLMKTGPGRKMARESTRRMEVFMKWWAEEVMIEEGYQTRIIEASSMEGGREE